MITLFPTNETSFTTNGLGSLRDAISCVVTEELNGEFELEMEYPITGQHYSDIVLRRIILANPNPYANPQPFRIYYMSKPINGIVTINAQHISYDMSGYPVSPFTATSAATALTNIKNASAIPCPFTFTTTNPNTGTLELLIPYSMRSLLGEHVLKLYGGEYEFDRYLVNLHANRGQNRGVSIRYGKNLTDLRQEENCSAVYTGVYPYWFSESKGLIQLPEKTINAPGTYDFTRIYPLNLSSSWNDPPTETQLRDEANKFMIDNKIGIPKVSINVSFVNLSQSDEYKDFAALETVNLSDHITVEFAELGVYATAQCIKALYNVLTNRYDSLELGDVVSNIGRIISDGLKSADKKIEEVKVNFTAEVDTIKIGLADIQDALIDYASIEHLEANYAHLINGYIDNAQIEDASIGNAKIGNAAINSAKIDNLAVQTGHIVNGAITSAKIGNAEVKSINIEDAAIDNAKIKDGEIQRAKIADAAIDSAKIDNLAVGTAHIKTGAITTALIEDGSITNAKIVELTADKIVGNTLDTSKVTIQGPNGKMRIANNRLQVFDKQAIPVERVSVGDVNGDDTLYGLRIRGADGITILMDEDGVKREGITDGAITNEKISSDADIEGSKLLDNSVEGGKLVIDSITAREIAAETITANELAANSITAIKIAAGEIKGTHIEANSITVNKLASDVNTDLDLSSNTSINMKIANIKIANKNLLLNSGVSKSGTTYLMDTLSMSEDLVAGQVYTIIIEGTKEATQTFGIWQNNGTNKVADLDSIPGTNLWIKTFTAVAPIAGCERQLRVYDPPASANPWTLSWSALYRSDASVTIPYTWQPAPEDLNIPNPPAFTPNKTLTFMDIISGSFNGNTFTRDAGTGWTAGFRSVETFTNGEYMETKVTELTSSYMIGFGTGTNDTNYATIDFAMYKTSNALYVYENSESKGRLSTLVVDDILRISIENNKVLIYKNDDLLYISITNPSLPMYIDASVTTANSSITNIVGGTITPGSARYYSDASARNAANSNLYASNASSSVSQMFSDSVLTPEKKMLLKKEWDSIVSEKVINDAQADLFSIVAEKDIYGASYNTLNTYITPLLASLTSVSSGIVGDTMRSNFKTYYDARTSLLNAIALKAKNIADTAQGNLEDAIINLTTSINASADTIQLNVNKQISDTEGKLRSEYQAEVQTSVDSFNVSFTNIQDQVTNNGNEISEIKNYMTYDASGRLILGKSTSPFQLTLSNEAIQFLSTDSSNSTFVPDANAVAWISKDKMLIDKAEFLSSMEIGSHLFEQYSGNNKVTIVRYVG